MLGSIRARLLLAWFLLIMLALGGAGAAFFSIFEHWGYLEARRALEAKAEGVQRFVDQFGAGQPLVETMRLYLSSTSRNDGIRFRVLDLHGRPILEPWTTTENQARPAGLEASDTWWRTERNGTVVLHLSSPIRLASERAGPSPVAGYIDYVRSLDDLSEATHHMQVVFAELGAALTAMGLALSYFVTRRIRRSVVEMREVASRMAAGNLGLRVPAARGDELGALGQTINSLADEIQRNIDSVTEERNKLDAILSSMVDAVITVRADGTVTFANSTAGRLVADYVQFRRTQGEVVDDPIAPPGEEGGKETGEDHPRAVGMSRLVGKNLYPILASPESAPPAVVSRRGVAEAPKGLPVHELVASCLGSGEAVSREIKLGDRDFNVFAIALKRAGEPEVLLLLRDITSLRQVEIARSQFLGNVSHELKTPLTIIKGFVVTLQKSPGITDEWKRYLDYIDRETDRLSRLVDDLLNLARLRSKRTQMNFTFCEPLELLKETYRQLLPQAAKYDVALAFDAPAELPVLLADTDRFKEIIINLVDNAFKYSPPKTRVELRAHATAEHLVVTVGDSGPGIPPGEVAYLFERFFRGTDKGGRKSGGSGIGLAIVKEIVDSHRGRIRVDSKVGEGTRFIIELPLRHGGRRRSDRIEGGEREA
jgi:two-component system phosphate regulon sensor histidine kinase PhoR